MAAQKNNIHLNSDVLHSRLKIRSLTSESALFRSHPTAAKFFKGLDLRPGKIRDHAARVITSGVLAGSLFLSGQQVPKVAVAQPTLNRYVDVNKIAFTPQQVLTTALQQNLTLDSNWQLSLSQESALQESFFATYGIHATPLLDGHRLNNSYGRMGAEQHLPRYPGDSADQHGSLVEKGITPGKGAWGYFTYSKADLTPELEATEKWYVAVQTLYLPDWNTNTKELAAWYKYRRVVVANPANGKVVIAAVADAGPAKFTGKHFGGSPEIMEYLGINYGKQNHPVVLFFLDDPEKKVPLGPLEYNINTKERLIANRL